MSYIVPREIPKNCIECPCGYETEGAFRDECSVLAREYEKDADSVRPNWCPLVEVKEPHGRLVDATFEENHYGSMLLNPTPDVTEQDKHNARIVIDALRMAKTVIEAEGENI